MNLKPYKGHLINIIGLVGLVSLFYCYWLGIKAGTEEHYDAQIGKACLFHAYKLQTDFYKQQGRYASSLDELGFTHPKSSPNPLKSDYFKVSQPSVSATGWEVAVTRTNVGQTFWTPKSRRGYKMTIDQTGNIKEA